MADKKINTDFTDLITATADNNVHRYDRQKLLERLQSYEGLISDDAYQQIMNAYSQYTSSIWSPNAWQAIGERFGDYAAWTNFENERMHNFNTAISEILNAQHQENYNDPAQQVDRQRSAGLNPDLTGGISSGTSGDIALPDNLPAPQNDGYSAIPEIGSTVMQTVSLAMSLAQGVQSLNAGEIQLGLDSLNLLDKSDQSILNTLGNALTEREVRILLDPTAKDVDGNALFSDDERLKASFSLGNALSLLREDKRLPRTLRNKIAKSWTPGAGSIKSNTQLYNLLSDVYGKKKNAVGLAGDPFNRGGFEECLTLIGEHIQSTIYDVQKLTSKFETDRLKVTGENGESLGTLAGRSDASAYNSEAYQKEYDAIVNKMWDSIMKDLAQGPDKDKWWSKVLRFAIPIVRLWLGNIKMPSVSHNTTAISASGHSQSQTNFSFGN